MYGKNVEPGVRKASFEMLVPGHDVVIAKINSQQLWLPEQEQCNNKPVQIPALVGTVTSETHPW